MRMTIWLEFKWLIAIKLLGWTTDLTHKQMTTDNLLLFKILIQDFKPNPKFNTVRRSGIDQQV